MEGGLDRLMHMLLWQLKGLSSTAALPPSLSPLRKKRWLWRHEEHRPHSLPPRQEGGEVGRRSEEQKEGRKEGSMSSCNSTLQHTTWSEEVPRLLTARTLETTK